MKHIHPSCQIVAALLAAFVAKTAFPAGFALYEMSAKATAVGGGVVAKPVDASANFYNPAGLSSLTGTVVTVGATMLKPTYDVRVNGETENKMDVGYFCVPSAFVSQELPFGFAAGLGLYADWGLASCYSQNWPLAWESRRTEFVGYTVNPNLSYRITDDWSVGAGVRLVRATFTQLRNVPVDLSTLGLGTRKMRLKFDVDNDLDVGYQLGTQYRVCESFSVGATWRSRVRLGMEGDSEARGVPGHVDTPYGRVKVGDGYEGKISEKLDLPMSASLGCNWDATKRLHIGSAVTWTEWSTIDVINFTLPSGTQTMRLGWDDVWRFGAGAAYDITDGLSLLAGYVYDIDPTSEKRPATMLPCGDRHNLMAGVSYAWGMWELSSYYMLTLQEKSTTHFTSRSGAQYAFASDNALCHGVGVTLSCRF